jgi:hypothetical protein
MIMDQDCLVSYTATGRRYLLEELATIHDCQVDVITHAYDRSRHGGRITDQGGSQPLAIQQ